MQRVCVRRYDVRIVRVGGGPYGEFVISHLIYSRVFLNATRGSVDIVIEGAVHSFSTELSTTEGEGHG